MMRQGTLNIEEFLGNAVAFDSGEIESSSGHVMAINCMASSVSSAGKMNQILCCDWLSKQAKWSYLGCLGLLAASHKSNFPESHIMNPLLTKLLQDGWILASFFFVNLWIIDLD